MLYIWIAIAVFIISSVLVYAITHKKYIGKNAEEKGVYKAQYFRGMFASSLFFTVVVMLIIKLFQG
ncbi:MAG: hypothetical protein JWN76_1357 [Chitinophagaceae bacterium]|nr:hypothetical protein [Chitinophagaceae bacterium]